MTNERKYDGNWKNNMNRKNNNNRHGTPSFFTINIVLIFKILCYKVGKLTTYDLTKIFFSHPRLVIYLFPTPHIKLKLVHKQVKITNNNPPRLIKIPCHSTIASSLMNLLSTPTSSARMLGQ